MFTYPKFTPKVSIKYQTPQIVRKQTSHTQNTTLPHVQAVKKYIKGLDIDTKSKKIFKLKKILNNNLQSTSKMKKWIFFYDILVENES